MNNLSFAQAIRSFKWSIWRLGFSVGIVVLILMGATNFSADHDAESIGVDCGADCKPVVYTVAQRQIASVGRWHATSLTVTTPFLVNSSAAKAAELSRLQTRGRSTLRDTLNTGSKETKSGPVKSIAARAQTLSPVKQNILIPTPGATPFAAISAAENALGIDGCPATSAATFDLIPIAGPAADRPDVDHADLNISLRGYTPVDGALELKFFYGATDADSPQLAGLFQPNRAAVMKRGYRVNHWNWTCQGRTHGCAGDPIDDWGVTMLGLVARPGEPISIPQRRADIYRGGYKAMVLYAAERQVTLGYARRDNVSAGYVVHIKDICVDPNLLALYRAQNDANGWRSSGLLPALRNDQVLGTALSNEVKVVVRDNGSFMDPRSRKDWWR